MALLVKVDGTRIEVFPANGTNFTLEELQKYVDGMIELAFFPQPFGEYLECLVNEEGLNLEMEVNWPAFDLCGAEFVGPVLFLKKGEMQ